MDGQKPNSDPAAHNKSASTETVFLPRSEFWRAPVTPHSFALLSFNGNEILRLANCPDNVVSAVRRALPQGDIRHFREDPDLVVCEFLLAGKPFSGRSVKQEQLLLNIFTAIMSQNYSLVTSIDYGRIYLDRLTLAFGRALTPASEKQNSERSEAFGLSFVSSTALRVVSPPLRFTPAILQVVRAAWPLGVVWEKREGDGSYLFKLKGYSFFKQSTFETDSLAHILELLHGMDGHGFTLITSMCLGKRSRVQDFWIFSAPAPPLPPTTDAGLAAISSLRKAGGSVGMGSASPGANTPPSPVQSHSMLGFSNTEDSPRTQDFKPRSPAPSSGSGGKPNVPPNVTAVAGAASQHERPPSNGQRKYEQTTVAQPRHARSLSLHGAPHVLRKSPPANVSKPSTPTRDYRTPDPTPRPSPREATRNLQPSPSLRSPPVPVPNPGYQYQQQQYPSQQYQQQPGARTLDPNYQQQQQPQYQSSPQQQPGVRIPGPNYQQQQQLQGQPPPQSYPAFHRPTSDASSQFLYNASPPPPGGYRPVYNTVPSGLFALPNIPQSQPQATAPPGTSESPASLPPPLRDLELETENDAENDIEDDEEHQGLGLSSALLGSSVFRDTLRTSEDFDEDEDVSTGFGNQDRPYLYSGVPGNDVRRTGDTPTTVLNEIHAHAGNTPRFVHPDLPEDDPAMRSSDEPSFSFVGSPPQPFIAAKFPHPGPEDARGVDRLEMYYETGPQAPMGQSYMATDDDSSTMPSPAVEVERPTTKAAEAEVVSYSGSLAKKQSQTLNTGAVKPDAPLAIRVVDEQTRNGPWVLVSPPGDTAPNGQAPPPYPAPQTLETRVSQNWPEQDVGENNKSGVARSARPAAVPVPIPAPIDVGQRTPGKIRISAFPWSKSRREQREQEKAQEKEKEKQRKLEEGSKRVVPPPADQNTAVQKDRSSTESEQLGVPKTGPAKPRVTSVAAETVATSSSDSSSSFSALHTPSGPAEGHQGPPSINEATFTKDLVGRLRKKPHAVTEVGTSEKRLTID